MRNYLNFNFKKYNKRLSNIYSFIQLIIDHRISITISNSYQTKQIQSYDFMNQYWSDKTLPWLM